MKNFQNISKNKVLYGLIVSSSIFKNNTKTNFITQSTSEFQLGIITKNKYELVKAHKHTPKKRQIIYTTEVLFIEKGSLKITFFDNENIKISSHICNKNNLIIIFKGGHKIEFLKKTNIFEIKQGPFQEDKFFI